MKKNYGYFKTLEKMSGLVYDSFSSVCDYGKCDSRRLTFAGEKSELLTNLINDFITPIERGDIFLLAQCLSEELEAVENLSEYDPLFFADCKDFSRTLRRSMENQNSVFGRLGNLKNAPRLIAVCQDELLVCGSLSGRIRKKVKITASSESHNLADYAVCCAYMTLLKSISNTFLQIEKILIDNS